VLDDVPRSDEQRRAIPVQMGTSHAVFVSAGEDEVSLRFFTATGELPACGHGTVAALSFLADRAGTGHYEATLRTSGRVFAGRVFAGRVFAGRAEAVQGGFGAAFDPGRVELREPVVGECDAVLAALGVGATDLCVASVGRPRLLVAVPARSDLDAIAPDLDRLRDACEYLRLLGCYVYCAPNGAGRVAARMFAPAVGVGEDIANANSTACLAARLGRDISVDMGDWLGSPSTITANVRHDGAGVQVRVGGRATIADVVPLPSRLR
jgi:trans-2,3-dihydro-3-hydroxyanthranilate isomerase